MLRARAVGKESVASKMSRRSSAGRAGSVGVECGVPVAMLGTLVVVFFWWM